MPRADPTARFLKISEADLEREIALRYEEGLLALQKRMHPESEDHPLPEGVVIMQRPGASGKPGEGETPEELASHGRNVARAMFEAFRAEICQDLQDHPGEFRTSGSGVPRLVGLVTRTTPPDELFLAAACWLWRQGLDGFCREGGKAA